MLQAVLEMEKALFTQNTHYLETCTEKWLSKYKDARAARGLGDAQAKDGMQTEAFSLSAPPYPIPPMPSTETKVQTASASLRECGITEGDLGELDPGDEYETELRVMAEVRGYFQVAYEVRQMPSFTFCPYICFC
jgi:hypothetical protein